MSRSSRDNVQSETISSVGANIKPIRTHSKHLSTEFEAPPTTIYSKHSPTNALFLKTSDKAKELFRSSKVLNSYSQLGTKAEAIPKTNNKLGQNKPPLVPQGTQEGRDLVFGSESPARDPIKIQAKTLQEFRGFDASNNDGDQPVLSPEGRKISAPGGNFNLSNPSRASDKTDSHKLQYFKNKRTEEIHTSARVKTFTVDRSNFSVRDFSPNGQTRTETSQDPIRREAAFLEQSELSVYDRPVPKNLILDTSGTSIYPRTSKLAQSHDFPSVNYARSTVSSSVILSPSMTTQAKKFDSSKRPPTKAKATNSLLEGNTRYFIDRIDELSHENSKLRQEKALWRADVELIKSQIASGIEPLDVLSENQDTVRPLKNKIKILEDMIRDYKVREKQMSAGQSMMSGTSFQHQNRYNTAMNTTSLVELGQQDSASPERHEAYTITSLKIKQEGELSLFKLRLSTLEAENAALRQSRTFVTQNSRKSHFTRPVSRKGTKSTKPNEKKPSNSYLKRGRLTKNLVWPNTKSHS